MINSVALNELQNAQTVQLLNNMAANQNSSAQRIGSQHNSTHRQASFSSNHSGGLLQGSQQRLNEKQIAPDMQQIIS